MTRSDENRQRSIVIGHRGAAGYRPEHTLASYKLAARLGADFLEPDLVVTNDGVLVCRHEPEIGGTTDVATHPEFASRKTTKMLDGDAVTGWFTEDFTLAELKTLRVAERLPLIRQHNTLFNGRYQIPTFQELLDLRARLSDELRRTLGVYPETKHPTFFQRAGLPLEPRLLEILRRNGLNQRDAPVFVQSFEVTNLKQLREAGLRPVGEFVRHRDPTPESGSAGPPPLTTHELPAPNTRIDAVNPCRWFRPATGPISPPAKNPATPVISRPVRTASTS
jgi:glycerophosphoryl diester phosphodiesterase